jgi:integral membrane protein
VSATEPQLSRGDAARADASPQPPAGKPQKVGGALTRYRIMAFTTGVVLIAGCIALIVKAIHPDGMEPLTGILWVLHGYLYLVYVISVADLALRVRWPLVRIIPIALAGTIPTMSFVAEHYVTRRVRADLAR